MIVFESNKTSNKTKILKVKNFLSLIILTQEFKITSMVL